MRRLSRSARVVASFAGMDGGEAVFKVSEVNGVAVTLVSADIHVGKEGE